MLYKVPRKPGEIYLFVRSKVQVPKDCLTIGYAAVRRINHECRSGIFVVPLASLIAPGLL